LVSAMLNTVPALRPDINQVLKHSWTNPKRNFLADTFRRSFEALWHLAV
jgi:hypothetical protein